MKKLLLSISLLLSMVVAFGQPKITRSTGANTNMDTRLGAIKNFLTPVYTDTTQANLSGNIGLDSCGAIIFTYDVMGFWGRSCSPKHWERVGGAGSISFENSPSITFSGTGGLATPIVANVNISPQAGNIIQSTGQGIYAPTFIQDGIIEPGVITWINNYNYDVSPAIGVIGGIQYTSDWTPITLANADPLLDRIDVVAFNAGGTISVITGTPADDPQKPTVDPSTQLELGFIVVTANTTQPPTPPTQDWIYQNYLTNAWNTLSSSVRINDQSTNNPYSVPTVVQATLAQNGDNIRFTSITPPTISNFNVITLKILSGSIWANDSKIELQWYSGATPIGNPVGITNGTFGYSSTNLSNYQILSAPLNQFGALSSVTSLLITVITTGNRTISFHIDDIQLQNGILPSLGYTADNAITLTGNNFQLGGPLVKNTLIPTTPYTLTLSGANTPSSTFNFNVVNTTGSAIKGQTTTGTGVQGSSAGANGYGVFGQNTVGIAGQFLFTNSSGNTSATVVGISRATSGTPSAGMGANLTFFLSGTTTPSTANLPSNRIVSTWTNPNTLSQVSQLVLTGVNNAVESDLLTLSGNGQLKFNKYVTGAFTSGTPTQYLATTSDGTVIQVSPSGISGITADNGLTANTATNVQLGGALLGHTTVDGGAANRMIFTSTSTNSDSATVVIRNTGAGLGRGLYVTSASGVGLIVNSAAGVNAAIIGNSSSGQAVSGSASTTGVGILGSSTDGVAGRFFNNPAGTNDIVTVVQISRTSSGVATSGIGGALDFSMESSAATDTTTRLISRWSDATFATRTSEFSITGVNNAADNATIFTLSGNGATRLNKYGIGTFTGTPAYTLQVDASGNVIEGSLGGGTYTASNGLTMTANNTVLGGTLTGNTTISTAGFVTTFIGNNTGGVLNLTNGGTGNAGTFQDIGSASTVDILKNSSNTNGERTLLSLQRATSGTAANGIAGTLDLYIESDAGSMTIANQIAWTYTTAANATRTSQMLFRGVNSALTNDLVTLSGNGAVRFNDYGTGAIAGTAAFALAVDATGNIIEIALGGGGGGTVNSVAGTLNRITSTGGTDPIIDISASYVGQTSITTLGTIATGVWNGTAIGDTYISSATTWNAKQAGDATLTALAGLTITNGSLIYGTGADAFSILGAGTNGQVLGLSGGIPAWVSVGSGSVTNVSGVNTNGFTFSIATPSSTPAITLGTSITGILKGNGTAISAAVAGIDYLTPTGSAALLTSFPTLNQNTTGSAATLTTPRNINGVAFDGSANITVTAAAGTLTGTTLNSSVVSSSLTSVGTITTGTWQGTAIGLGFGGTGLTAGGSANQILGMNAAGNASQYKTFTGLNGVTITHSVGGVTIANTFNPTVQTLTDGATITWNVTNGGNAKVTLTGTGRTLVLQNPVAGYTYTIEITQGSGGSKTITTWPSGSTWTGSNTLSTTAGDVDVVVLYYNGTNLRNVLTTDYN